MYCLHCNSSLPKRGRNFSNKYCNNQCQADHRYSTKLAVWLETGKQFAGVKDWILKDQNFICAICPQITTWHDKPLVFVLDHIDGNATNNLRSNLRCICPHCDSQLPTFKNRNKGNGRHSRKLRYQKGKSY